MAMRDRELKHEDRRFTRCAMTLQLERHPSARLSMRRQRTTMFSDMV